jgi:YD repeat-containing protein
MPIGALSICIASWARTIEPQSLLIYPSRQVVTYTYDAANRLTTVTDWDGQSTTYAYDLAGRLITTTLPNSVTTINTYDAAGRLIEISNLKFEISGAVLLSQFEYELDAVGNRIAVTETIAQPAGPGPVVVTVQDTDGAPQVGLPVYVFSGTTYLNYNGTTNASGQVTLTLPAGNYRFRADKNGTQFWSGTGNHCSVPGCTSVAITTSLLTVVTVQDANGAPEAGLPVYAYDGDTYTNFTTVHFLP